MQFRYVEHFMSQDKLRTIYFSYFHSLLSYGIIFWVNSAYSSNTFKIQTRIVRIIMNARNKDSCHQLFKNLKILPLKSQCIFPFYYLLPKIEIYMNQISEIHNVNTRFISDLPYSNCKLNNFPKSFLLFWNQSF
jgi:hypothetical protein